MLAPRGRALQALFQQQHATVTAGGQQQPCQAGEFQKLLKLTTQVQRLGRARRGYGRAGRTTGQQALATQGDEGSSGAEPTPATQADDASSSGAGSPTPEQGPPGGDAELPARGQEGGASSSSSSGSIADLQGDLSEATYMPRLTMRRDMISCPPEMVKGALHGISAGELAALLADLACLVPSKPQMRAVVDTVAARAAQRAVQVAGKAQELESMIGQVRRRYPGQAIQALSDAQQELGCEVCGGLMMQACRMHDDVARGMMRHSARGGRSAS